MSIPMVDSLSSDKIKTHRSQADKWLGLAAKVLLLCAMLVVVIPFLPQMPEFGLDPAWRLGMNVGVAEGFRIGSDIIFTFGPYSAVYTRDFHPATDALMMWGSLLLALVGWFSVLIASGKRSALAMVLLALALPLSVYARDALFFLLPLLIGLAVNTVSDRPRSLVAASAALVILLVPLGLLPLVKGTLLVVCVAVTGLAFLLMLVRREWLLLALTVVTPIASMVAAWVIAGQPLATLPLYFANMLPIIQGYTEAMALTGRMSEIIVYLAVASAVPLVLLLQNRPHFEKAYVFLLFCLILFVSFKSGFVRHDGHALIAVITLLLASICLLLARQDLKSGFVVFLSCAGVLYISTPHLHSPSRDYVSALRAVYIDASRGLYLRVFQPDTMSSAYDQALVDLKSRSPLPLLEGSTDIYSYQLGALIASGNDWHPRPIFQSYSVYTASLAEKNRAHLASINGPQHIFFNIEPIDNRFPALEDGLSWPELLGRYEPVQLLPSHLQLQRTSGNPVSLQEISEGSFKLGQPVPVPGGRAPIFMSMDIKQSLLGRFASLFFKPSQLQLVVKMRDGRQYGYRFVATMAQSGFVVSPLITSTKQFGLMWGDHSYLSAESVESVTVSTSHRGRVFWQEDYQISLSSLENIPKWPVEDMYDFAKPERNLFNNGEIVTSVCEGVIDSINNASPVEPVTANGILHVTGWLLASQEHRRLPEATYLLLNSVDEGNYWIKASVENRPDVGMHFEAPELSASGFSVDAVVAGLQGDYDVSLAFVSDGVVTRCSNINGSVKVGLGKSANTNNE